MKMESAQKLGDSRELICTSLNLGPRIRGWDFPAIVPRVLPGNELALQNVTGKR